MQGHDARLSLPTPDLVARRLQLSFIFSVSMLRITATWASRLETEMDYQMWSDFASQLLLHILYAPHL